MHMCVWVRAHVGVRVLAVHSWGPPTCKAGAGTGRGGGWASRACGRSRRWATFFRGTLFGWTLSESKSFLKQKKNKHCWYFSCSAFFLHLYIKAKAIEKWIIKNLKICTCLKKIWEKKLQKNVKQMGLVIEIFFRECGSVCVCVRVCDRAQAVVWYGWCVIKYYTSLHNVVFCLFYFIAYQDVWTIRGHFYFFVFHSDNSFCILMCRMCVPLSFFFTNLGRGGGHCFECMAIQWVSECVNGWMGDCMQQRGGGNCTTHCFFHQLSSPLQM